MKKSALVVFVGLVVATGVVLLFTRHRKAEAPAPTQTVEPGPESAGRLELGREFLGYPEQFPKALAFMPASFDSSSKTKDANGTELYSLTYRGESSPEFFGTVYREHLEKEGWSVFLSSAGTTVVVRAEHGSERATVTIRPLDTRISTVQIIYYPSK